MNAAGPTLKEAAVVLATLAKERLENHRSKSINLPVDIGAFDVDALWRPDPHRAKILEFLRSLPPDLVLQLRTVMYLGRGDAADPHALHDRLLRENPSVDDAMRAISEKLPLADYISRGLPMFQAANPHDKTLPPRPPPFPQPTRSRHATKPPPACLPVYTISKPDPPADIMRDSGRIFLDIASRWDETVSPDQIQALFSSIKRRTGGWVIVDFVDLGSWDCIEGFTFDKARNILTLYWHDFRGRSGDKDPSITVFPAALYGLVIHLQEVRIVRGKKSAIFLLRGYALSEKDVKRQLTIAGSEVTVSNEAFFAIRAVRKIGGQAHVFDALSSALYTVAIVPKGIDASKIDSRLLLLSANLSTVRADLELVIEELSLLDAAKRLAIQEKANTARRLLEAALKIEIVYRDLKPKKPYGKLLLGDLLGELSPHHPPWEHELLGRMAGWANDFSHDTGRPVRLEIARLLAVCCLAYIELLTLEISLDDGLPSSGIPISRVGSKGSSRAQGRH